ncbi:MAG: hypothetical protein JJO71_24145 [Escherichia coli]|nr:hypothetical protein [Escherichia coli]
MMVVFAASVASAFAEVWTPEYNDNLEATVPFSALKADGGIKIEQEKEGAIKVTSDGTGGKLAIELPDEGIDISNGFVVTFTGDNGLFEHLDLSSKDYGSLGGLYSSKYVYNAKTDNSRIGKLEHVNKMEWIGTNTAGTMVITSIVIKKLFHLAADEVNLTTSMFRDWTHYDNLIDNGTTGCANAIGEKLNDGGLLYGNVNVLGKTFADLTGYKALRIYASEGDQFRILMNRPSDNREATAPEETITADASGVATLDISKYEEFHLNAIKLPWNGRKNVTVKAIALVYGDSPVFSETSYWNPISKTTLQLNVTRNLVAGLNTICLPFNVDASQFGSVFGDADAKAYQFIGVEDNKLRFEEATSIEAGVPYLLTMAQAHEMGNVGKVDILVEEPKAVTVDGVTFKGTFNVKVLDEKNLFLGKDGNLKVPASTEGDNNKLKGMRAFFVLPESTTAYSLSFGGETTGIQAIEGEKAEKAQGVYTISGVKVADNTANLAKGLYIVNGKKFIQK